MLIDDVFAEWAASGDDALLRGADLASLRAAMSDTEHGGLRISNKFEWQIWQHFATKKAWRPVRVIMRGRKGFFRNMFSRNADPMAMIQWCQKNCKAGWVAEGLSVALEDKKQVGVTFWFETEEDSSRFAFRWMSMGMT